MQVYADQQCEVAMFFASSLKLLSFQKDQRSGLGITELPQAITEMSL